MSDGFIEADGLALVDVGHLAACAGMPAPPAKYVVYLDTEDGYVRYRMDREQVEKFAREALVLICDT